MNFSCFINPIHTYRLISYVCILFIYSSCEETTYTPKPKIYPRVNVPQANYIPFDTSCAYSFLVNSNTIIKPSEQKQSEPCWIIIIYPSYNATIYISYKPGKKDDIQTYIEESRTLVYNHTIKASAIREKSFTDSLLNKFAMVYILSGDAATPLQFHVSDMNKNFLRGSIYFNHAPNEDSLKPVIQYLQKDIEKIIETIQWK